MQFDTSVLKTGFGLSNHRTTIWLGCPLRFAFCFIAKRYKEEPEGDMAKRGKLAHLLTAELRQRWLESGADVRQDHLSMLAINKAGEVGLSEEAAAEVADLVVAAANKIDLLPDRKNVSKYWIEERVAMTSQWNPCDWFSDQAYWRSIVDFAYLTKDGTLFIEDDKSGWAEPDMRQALGYGWVFSRLCKPEMVVCSFNMLAKKTNRELPPFNPEELNEFPGWVEEIRREILNTEDFEPRLGGHCGYCGFVAECPAHQKVGQQIVTLSPEKLRVPQTLEEAERGGLFLMAAERYVSEVKRVLREYVEANGSVALADTGKELRLDAATDWEGSAGDILGAMLQAGLPKDLILDRMSLRWKNVESVLAGAYPLAGKGISAAVKADNKFARKEVGAKLRKLGVEKPRQATFGIFNSRED